MKITIETWIKSDIKTIWKAWNSPEDIVCWSAGSDDWHTTRSTVDLREGGRFLSRMEARDGSMGFDLDGTYTTVVGNELIEYVMEDGRTVSTRFNQGAEGVQIIQSFDTEAENPVEMQRAGWQHILNNFTRFVESSGHGSNVGHENPDMGKVSSKPDNMHTLTPHLVCAGAADAIAFYVRAFGGIEESRLVGADGKLMHAVVRIGDSALMLVDENVQYGMPGPRSLNGSPVTIHLFVDDVDATVAKAVEAGARVTMPVADMFWGDRYGRLEDPFGHRWSVATRQQDLSPAQIQAALTAL